jgi:hypothetical protein
MGAKGIIEFLIENSKEWLRALHAKESKKKYKIATVFPSIHEILVKIQNYCKEKHVYIFGESEKTSKIAPVVIKSDIKIIGNVVIKPRISDISKGKQSNNVKKGSVAISFSKWTVEEPEFPPLELSKSVQSDPRESLDFEKIVFERSYKSTFDTIDNRSRHQTNPEFSSINIEERSQSDTICANSLNCAAVKNEGSKNLENKDLKDNEGTNKLTPEGEVDFQENEQDSREVDLDVSKDRNSKSLTKNKDKPEISKLQKASNSHNNSPARRKNGDNSQKIESKKSSIDKKLNFKDEASTSESILNSNFKGSDIESYIAKNQECLTELDIKILESMNKSQISFDRACSRYQFVSESQIFEEQKPKDCHRFSNLVFSFLEENPLRIKDVRIDQISQSDTSSNQFRLFGQSYSFALPKRPA